jgi:hypothetical protein
MNGKPLPLNMIVYGAVCRYESMTGITNGVQRGISSGIDPTAFKKMAGPAPTGGASFPPFGLTRARGSPLTPQTPPHCFEDANKTPEPSTRDPSSATAVPDSVSADSAQAKILRLLRVLHALDADARSTSLVPASLVGEAAFVNNKLTVANSAASSRSQYP